MTIRLPLLAAALAVVAATSCAVADASPPGTREGFTPEADSWHDIMEDVIGPIYDDYLVREAEDDERTMNLPGIAEQATRAANHMALGHGVHELNDVPRYADYAREAEAWLRDIAEAAAAGNAERTREMILSGELEHCERCHTAAR